MLFFDAHIHLTDFENLKPENLMADLQKAGVEKCVCVAAKISDWEKIAKFANGFPFEVVPSFGVHPWYALDAKPNFIDELKTYLQKFDNAVIGECGFDGLKSKNEEMERKVFEAQLECAFEYKRPLMLHMVKADMFLEKYWGRLPEKSVFHSFSGSIEILKKILKFGHYISVNERFFKKKNATEILNYAPTERLLVETDAPFQSEISDLKSVAEKIAKIKQEMPEDLSRKLYLNTLEVFIGD